MLSIGIRELRQHASRYVALVRCGQRVAVTDRGSLVAYLVPADSGSPLDRLAASGCIQPAAGSILDLLNPPPAPPSGARPLSDVVAELRSSERW
jgi:prevent-host-death family protein